jgi:2-octaprenyl-6-methoxyphenol hydroxylase
MARAPRKTAPRTTFDVIVAGGGMTGQTLALALADAGVSVALCDAEPIETRLAPAFDGRASAIAAANWRQWKALGIAAMLEADAQPLSRILVTDGPSPGASARAPMPVFLQFGSDDLGAEPGEPMGRMVENRHIRAALAKALTARKVVAFAPAAVTAMSATDRGAQVTLKDGTVLEAPLVVGADGRRSVVRSASGIGTYGWDYAQAGVVATVALERDHEGIAHEYFLPGGPLAILPLTGQRASLVWSEDKRRAKALVDSSVEAFEAHLARRFGSFLGRATLIGERAGFPLSLQMAERMIGPRAALIGDAAHAIHPIAGQGLNMGLKDAAALAEVIVDARRLGEDWGSELVLERYARWRRFDAAALAAATDLFTRLFSNDHPALRLMRGAGLALVNRAGPAKRLFVREAAGMLGETPRLLRGEAL